MPKTITIMEKKIPKLTQDTNNVIVKGHTRSFINCKGRAKNYHCHNSNMYCYLKFVFFLSDLKNSKN